MVLTLNLNETRPFVRYAEEEFVYATADRLLRAYDHRIFYVVSGEAEVTADGRSQRVGPGAVMYWPSGTSYRICPAEGSRLRMIKVNFDMTQAHRDKDLPIPVVGEGQWEEKYQLERMVFEESCLNGPLVLEYAQSVLTYLRSLVAEIARPTSCRDAQISNLMNCALVMLCRMDQDHSTAGKGSNVSRALLDHIHVNYAEPLTNRQLGEAFGYHPNYIGRFVLEQTGMPLHRYLLQVRIRQAIHLLTTTQLTVAQIAETVGFRDVSYFTQYFKQCTGHTPGNYRKGHF